jgi:hypothetical protein
MKKPIDFQIKIRNSKTDTTAPFELKKNVTIGNEKQTKIEFDVSYKFDLENEHFFVYFVAYSLTK